MTDLTNVLGGPWSPPAEQQVAPAEDQVRDAMASAGLDPPEEVYLDGQIHRFPTNGKKGDDAGWYVIYPDGVPSGSFGSWRDGLQQNWRMDMGRSLSPAEEMAYRRRQAEARQMREADQRKRAERTQDTVEQIWAHAGAASPDHPYLRRKRIHPNGARVTGDGRLIVPLFAPTGELSSVQYIDSDGNKQYHAGGKVKACQYLIGSTDHADTLYIAEGFATAATIHEVTGVPTAVAYSAGNLTDVACYWRSELGYHVSLVVVADNDESGVGKAHAHQASAKSGARVVVPEVPGDANDYVLNGHDLLALLHPPRNEWLIPADEMSQQPAPLRWHIKRWIQAAAMMMVHGPSGSGKTFVVLDMVMRAASGIGDWMGHRVSATPVVYLAGEGHHGMRGRIAAWKQHHGVEAMRMWVSSSGCDLNKLAGTQQAIEAVRRLPESPGIIVVDTLHRFLDGDENSAQDAKEMLDACAHLMAEFQATVILVHHTGNQEDAKHRARGSSAWRGALDIEISVVPAGEHQPGQIIQRKAKDAEIAEPIYFSLEPVEIAGWLDEDGEQVTSAVLIGVEASPEKASERDDPVARQIKRFNRAWWATGAEEVDDGHPYVSRSGLQAWMESEGMKPGSIRNALAPNGKFGVHLIATLIDAEVIQARHNGYVVIDLQVASSWLLLKGESHNQSL